MKDSSRQRQAYEFLQTDR